MNRRILPVPQTPPTTTPSVDRRQQDPGYPVRERVRPPEGAPNVLVVLVDDMGFGASSAYGGPCRMPTAERLASDENLKPAEKVSLAVSGWVLGADNALENPQIATSLMTVRSLIAAPPR